MNLQNFTNKLIEQIATDLTDAFDSNFDTESFFGAKWKKRNSGFEKHKILSKRGGSGLRGSFNPVIGNQTIQWKSSLPYASIHNEGGEIKVTAKMKSFFWRMYYKASGGVVQSVKTKEAANTARNKKLQGEAAKWRAMALLKVGTVLKIEQRQFIGWHPQVDVRIKEVVNYNLEVLNSEIIKTLKK